MRRLFAEVDKFCGKSGKNNFFLISQKKTRKSDEKAEGEKFILIFSAI